MKAALIKPYDEKTGIGEFANGLYSELASETDYEVVSLGLEEKSLPILDRSYKIHHVVKTKLKGLQEDYDLIFLPSHTWAAGISPEKLNCKVAVVVHDLERFLSSESNMLQQYNRKKSVLNTIKCDYVFLPSENSRLSLLKATDQNPDKTYVIGEGVETSSSPSGVERDMPDNFLLYVGDTQKRKNVGTLVDAFAELKSKNTHLILAGRIYRQKDRDRIEKKIDQLAISERVHLMGEVSSSELAYLYSHCIAYVHPAYFEGFGRTPIEAAAYGAAVSVVKATAPAEFLESAFWSEPTKKGLKVAMEELIRNPSDYYCKDDVMGLKWSNVADKVRKVLE